MLSDKVSAAPVVEQGYERLFYSKETPDEPGQGAIFDTFSPFG